LHWFGRSGTLREASKERAWFRLPRRKHDTGGTTGLKERFLMTASLVILDILALLLVLLVVFMWSPVRFRLHVAFARGGLRYDAQFKPPLLPWYLNVLRPRPGRRAKRLRGVAQETSAPVETGVLDRLKTLAGSARTTLAQFDEIYPKIREVVSMALRSVTVDEFRLWAAVGSGDAYETALLAGSLRALSSIGISVARRKGLRFEERPRVSVQPVYHRQHLSAELRVVASVVPWRALVVAVAFYRQFKQVRRPRPAVSKSAGWNTKA